MNLVSTSSNYGNRDLKQIFSDAKTYFILSFGLLTLLFIYFLGGWDGFYAVFEWSDEFDDALMAVFGPAVLFLVGLILILLGFHEYKEYSLIKNTPTSTIRSAAMGRVEVKGITSPINSEYLLESPFVGEQCLAYECKVEEYDHDDDGGDWHTVYTGREVYPFRLQDDTGELVVNPAEAEWSIGDYEYREQFRENNAPDRIQSFLEREIDSGMLDIDLFGGERMRFSENRIPPDHELYVLGGAKPLGPNLDVDLDEADILIEKDEHTDMFYVSEKSEQQIISSKWWGILALFGGGFVLTPASAVILCHVLGVL